MPERRYAFLRIFMHSYAISMQFLWDFYIDLRPNFDLTHTVFRGKSANAPPEKKGAITECARRNERFLEEHALVHADS